MSIKMAVMPLLLSACRSMHTSKHRALKKSKFEPTLLQTLSPVLAKEPASRTEFDNLVLANLEEAVTAQIAAQAKLIEDTSVTKQERSAATATATSALEAAKAAVEAADASKNEAESAVKGGDSAVKDARKALKACGPGAKDAAAAVTMAESSLADFSKGALATFKELQNRTVPVEEPPAPAEEAPANDAPAAEN